MTASDVILRTAGPADLDSILEVCSAALGWSQPHWDRQLFTWKHEQNAFGSSLILVAEDETGILAVRTLMQWRFASDTGVVRAARAVDTATRPDAQGRGLFRSLTELGIELLEQNDVGFIFNTPNSQSRPGYLRMGWRDAGRIGVGVRVRSPLVLPRVIRSRTAATKPSIPTPELGIDPDSFIDSLPEKAQQRVSGWRTDHSPATLSWRYVAGPVSYRALPMSDSAGALVRVRQRGRARELLVAEQVGEVDARVEREALVRAMSAVGADHLIGATRTPGTTATKRLGPQLTVRDVASAAPGFGEVAWTLGDIELF